jgi:hypothetical protein
MDNSPHRSPNRSSHADDRAAPPARRRRPRRRFPFGWAAVVVFLAVLGAGAWYALRVLRALPERIGSEGKEVVREVGEQVGDLVRAFRTGTVQRRFEAFTQRVEGTNHLQVVRLDQVQRFELEDRSAVFWGTVELPPVVVRATAPVQYVYFVDLEGTWRFDLRDERVLVTAPALRSNKPAIDVSRMRWQVVRGSLLRDEHEVQEQLRRELTGRAAIQARVNLPVVRETARRQVAPTRPPPCGPRRGPERGAA